MNVLESLNGSTTGSETGIEDIDEFLVDDEEANREDEQAADGMKSGPDKWKWL